MDFSVLIASRNRPALLRRAVQSVLDQTLDSVEVLVIDDGSHGDHAAAYRHLSLELPRRVRFLHLPQVDNGHGQSFAINFGAMSARGAYFCFLDDDDYWTDDRHLERALACLRAEPSAETYLSNQLAYRDEVPLTGPIWLEPIEKIARARGARAVGDALVINIDDLVQCANHCHFNTTIVSRSLFERVGGLDRFIRYENDRDFYLRYIDQASAILYFPGVVSHHVVPDPSKKANASTRTTYLEKMFCRTYIYNKARLFSRNRVLREAATKQQAYTLRNITYDLANADRARDAFAFAREALAVGFGFKWMLYCCFLGLRTLARSAGDRHRNREHRS